MAEHFVAKLLSIHAKYSRCTPYFAEETGFEPAVPCGTLAFQASTLNHSATPPYTKLLLASEREKQEFTLISERALLTKVIAMTFIPYQMLKGRLSESPLPVQRAHSTCAPLTPLNGCLHLRRPFRCEPCRIPSHAQLPCGATNPPDLRG